MRSSMTARRVGLFVVAAVSVCGLPMGSAIAQSFRTIDGTGNNLTNPNWGSLGLSLSRRGAVNYLDGVGSVDMSRANPRAISNAVFASPGPLPDHRGLSEMSWAWGQFISHDISHTLTSAANGTLNVTIPFGDPYFDSGPNSLGGQNITLNRAEFRIENGSRQQVNNITGWIDANTVYGGRFVDGPVGTDRHDWLRTFSGGQLRVSTSAVGDLMPLTEAGAPVMANTAIPTMGANTFVAGDVRANEHVGLVSLHTLFVREHNRIADVIATAAPGLSDEEVFQRSKKIVGAQMQAITYNEYLPSLGINLGSYGGYDDSVSPDVTNEFSTAAFRLHSQIAGTLQRLNADGSVIAAGNLELVDAFFNPGEILNGGLEAVFRGLVGSTQEAADAVLVDGLRNQLFERFLPGVGLVTDGSDLVSLNIMRGRDHGLATYNDTREAYGLGRANDWSDITSNVDVANALASVYASVDDVDLYAGMLAEGLMAGSSISETVAIILADQFDRLRASDRFWFENDLDGVNSDLADLVATFDGVNMMTAADWLSGLTLGELLNLNTDTDFRGNVFFTQVIPAPSAFGLLMLGGVVAGRRRRRTA